MFLPIRTDSPLRATPWMNYALIGANLLVFSFQSLAPDVVRTLTLNPRDLATGDFVSYAFLHSTWMHVLSNMLFLYIFGNNVNDKMGHVGYLGFYLSAAVVAGLGHVLTHPYPGPMPSVVGASGAVWAVTAAYLVLFPRSSITIVYFFIIVGQQEVPSVFFVLLYFARDLYGFFGNANLIGDNTAYAAHVGGAVFGAVVSLGLLAVGLLPRDQFDVLAVLRQWRRRQQYRDLVSQGYDPFAYATPAPLAAAGTLAQDRLHDVRAAINDAVAAHDLPKASALYLELTRLDPAQVLARQAQLDVANQLASQQRYTDAAAAYERFLQHYPNFEQVEQVELMLGLVYARYLARYQLAKQYLIRSLAKLHTDREIEMAKHELARIEPLLSKPSAR